MADDIRINGNQYEWASIEIKIDGESYFGITSISHSHKRERSKGYGVGKHHAPRGRTKGKYSAEAKMTMWKSSAEALREALDDGLGNYGDTVFQITISYIEDGSEIPIVEELIDCVIAGEDASHEENPDPLKEDIALDLMAIKKNGRTLFDNIEFTF